jgi:hypothetical protein
VKGREGRSSMAAARMARWRGNAGGRRGEHGVFIGAARLRGDGSGRRRCRRGTRPRPARVWRGAAVGPAVRGARPADTSPSSTSASGPSRWWRCSSTPASSSQSSSTYGRASTATGRCTTASMSCVTATTTATALWGFLLGSRLLEARQQTVGPSDRHPSENTSGEEKTFTQRHSPTI